MLEPFLGKRRMPYGKVRRPPQYNRHLAQKQDRATSSFSDRVDNLDTRSRVIEYRLKRRLDWEDSERLEDFLDDDYVLALMDGAEISYIEDRGEEGMEYIENAVNRVKDSINTQEDAGYSWLSGYYSDIKPHITDALKPWNSRVKYGKIPVDNNRVGHVVAELERIGLAERTGGRAFYAEGAEEDFEMIDRILGKLEGAEQEIRQS